MRKDIKKSSYYVWFLGAQEAKGLRGTKYVNPVIRSLIEREREVEPFKVTLQVSYKGLKIIQNLPNTSSANSADKATGNNNRKTDIVKHFIPHHAVTYVLQDDDIVACILLLYNPVTKCPVHVHGYRCDSVETATILSGQLQILIERPENQKKLSEIEVRLKAKGLLLSTPPSVRRVENNPPLLGSDTKSSSSRDSEFSRASSSERISGFAQQERIANLYDSLAAELREKLNTGDPQPHSPILLPPRDYDTVHRQKGNLSGIDLRRCLSMNIVGMNVANNSKTPEVKTTGPKQNHTGGGVGAKFDSSGASSGIGSDHAPSPDQESDTRFLDSNSTSDEDFNAGLPLFLEKTGQMGGGELSLPRAAARLNNFPETSPLSVSSSGSHEYHVAYRGHRKKNINDENSVITPHAESDFPIHRVHRQHNPESINPSALHQKMKPIDNSFVNKDHCSKSIKENKSIMPQTQQVLRPETSQSKIHRPRKNAEERQRSPSPTSEKWLNASSVTPRDRFNDAKEKFLLLERERLKQEKLQRAVHNHSERRRYNQSVEPPIFTEVFPIPYSRRSWSRSRASDDDVEDNQHMAEYFFGDENDFKYSEEREHIKPIRHNTSYQKIQSDDSNDSESFTMRHEVEHQFPYNTHKDDLTRVHHNTFDQSGHKHTASAIPKGRRAYDRYPNSRQESNPEIIKRDEKHGSPIQNSPRPMPRLYSEDSITEEIPPILKVKPPKGNLNSPPFPEDNTIIPLERYRNPTRINEVPRPTPRHQHYPSFKNEQEDSRHDYRQLNRSDSHYYTPQNKYESNKNSFKSLHETIQDERKRNSNEIANEFKRRSYQAHQSVSNTGGYQELDDFEKHPGLDRDTARIHYPQGSNTKSPGHGDSSASSPRYRHSYAESFLHHQPQLSHNHELLHRNNSSVSTGRVGIAAIHPY